MVGSITLLPKNFGRQEWGSDLIDSWCLTKCQQFWGTQPCHISPEQDLSAQEFSTQFESSVFGICIIQLQGACADKHNRSSFRKERNRPRWGRSLAMLLLTSPQFFMPPTASHAALHLVRFLAAQLRNIAPALHLSWSPNYILDNSNRCCKILPRDWHSWQDTCDHSRVERFCSTRTRLAQTWTSRTFLLITTKCFSTLELQFVIKSSIWGSIWSTTSLLETYWCHFNLHFSHHCLDSSWLIVDSF